MARNDELNTLTERVANLERSSIRKEEMRQVQDTLAEHGDVLEKLVARFDKLDDRFDKIDDHLGKLEAKWDERFESLERLMYAHHERLTKLESDMGKLMRHFDIT